MKKMPSILSIASILSIFMSSCTPAQSSLPRLLWGQAAYLNLSQLRPSSPAIEAGAIRFEWKSEIVLDLQSGAYTGAARDLGDYEINFMSI